MGRTRLWIYESCMSVDLLCDECMTAPSFPLYTDDSSCTISPHFHTIFYNYPCLCPWVCRYILRFNAFVRTEDPFFKRIYLRQFIVSQFSGKCSNIVPSTTCFIGTNTTLAVIGPFKTLGRVTRISVFQILFVCMFPIYFWKALFRCATGPITAFVVGSSQCWPDCRRSTAGYGGASYFPDELLILSFPIISS